MDCSRRRGAPALVSSRSSINMECVSGGCQQQHFTRKMWAWVFVIPNSSQESESTAMLLFCHLSKSSCGEKEDVFLTIPEEGNDCRSNLFLSLSINDLMGGLPFLLPPLSVLSSGTFLLLIPLLLWCDNICSLCWSFTSFLFLLSWLLLPSAH